MEKKQVFELDNKATKKILAELDKLEKERVTIVLLLICGRLARNNEKFCIDQKWKDPSFFPSILNRIWDSLITKESLKEVDVLKEEILQSTPDADDFTSDFTMFAIYAGTAFYYFLEWNETEDKQTLEYIISSDFDTFYMFVDIFDSDGVAKLERVNLYKKLIKKECDAILTDIQTVKNIELVKENLVKLKSDNFPPPKSNIGF